MEYTVYNPETFTALLFKYYEHLEEQHTTTNRKILSTKDGEWFY